MAASDYMPIFFKNRLHLAGRPQMSTHPSSVFGTRTTRHYMSPHQFRGLFPIHRELMTEPQR